MSASVFVGFGFGAIQAGLFLYEAHRTGAFSRLVAAEVDPIIIEAVRANGNRYTVNIAHADRLEQAEVGPVELYNPLVPEDREALVQALAQATEAATALPSISFYTGDSPASVAQIIADALSLRDNLPLVIYTAENHNHAAENLEESVRAFAPSGTLHHVQFLNTVIGKMSGVLPLDQDDLQTRLAPIAPGIDRAFLVEEFNRILISHVRPGTARHITVFEERPHLLPFEEAKLYGHNAIHAMGGYLAALAGMQSLAELPSRPAIVELMHRAFIEESGAALVRKHHGLDILFTEAGMRHYAEDLLQRMMNPWLEDAVVRVTRDPLRKLAWDDRLIGALRLTHSEGIAPQALAIGAAAAVASVIPHALDEPAAAEAWLSSHWHDAIAPPEEEAAMLMYIAEGMERLREWRGRGFN